MDKNTRKNHLCLLLVLTVALFYSINTWAKEDHFFGFIYVGNLEFWCDSRAGEATLNGYQKKKWYYPEGGYYVGSSKAKYIEGKYDVNVIIPEYIQIKWDSNEWDGREWVTIEYHATVRVTKIEWLGLVDHWDIESIYVPSSVREIGEAAFESCYNLKKIVLPPITRIEDRTFESCKTLEEIEIPNTVTYIGEKAFSHCEKLKSVSIPRRVTYIGREAFSGCFGLTQINFAENSQLQFIGREAFNACRFRSLCLPNSVKEVGLFALNAYYLEEVQIGNGLESLNSNAFKDCNRIKKIVIGDGLRDCHLKSIGTDYFKKSDCTLSEIICYAKEPPTGSKDWPLDIYKNATLTVPEESIEKYKQSELWGPFFVREGKLNLEVYKGHDTGWKGKPARGVTADGASQLMFYVDIKDKNFIVQDYEITLTPDIEIGSLPDLEGGLVNNPDIVGKVEVKSKLENGKWGFIYTAPQDYPKTNDSYKYSVTIDLKLKGTNNKEVNISRCFDIVRPGVLLLHGFYSDSDCFAGLKNDMLESGSWRSWQVYNANYKSTNTAPFKTNVTIGMVKNQLDELATMMFGLQGIVSSKYDIVGHSMGGLMARLYAPSDDINRVITLDTPHLGSELADYACDAASMVHYGIDIAKEYYSAKWERYPGLQHLNQVLDYIEGFVVESIERKWGALEDLRTNSEAIKSLNPFVGAPVHAICSYMVHDQWNSSENYWKRYDEQGYKPIDTWMGMYAFNHMLSDQHVDNTDDPQTFGLGEMIQSLIFQGKNDGVVSYTSQIGGLGKGYFSEQSDAYEGLYGTKSWAFHCMTNKWESSYSLIEELLREQKSSDCFTNSFAKTPNTSSRKTIGVKRQMPDFKVPSDDTTIALTTELSDDSNILKAHIEKSDDIVYSMVFAFLDDKEMILGIDSLDYSFIIPETYMGDLTVCAMGRTRDFAIVADTTIIHFDRKHELSYMFFDNIHTLFMNVGQRLEPSVVAGWTSGNEYYISPKLTTDQPGMLGIEGSVVTGLESGRCMLVAEYLDMKDTIQVVIEPGNEADLPESINTQLKDNDVNVLFESNKLIIKGKNNGDDDNIQITILNEMGQIIKKTKVSRGKLNDGPIVIDVSYLPKQVYIAVVRGGGKTEVVKFTKL